MKTILTALFALCTVLVNAQNAVPQKLNYQAVARNAAGTTIANQSIKVKAEILDADQTTVLYAETHSVITNPFGLFTLQVGGGTVLSGNFSTIDWGDGNKFISTSVDLTGGTIFKLMGTSQLLSVPYSLYSQKAKYAENNGGKTIIILTDTISDAGARTLLAAEAGPNTQIVRIIECPNLKNVDLSMVNNVSEITITNNPVLESVNFSNLKSCTGIFNIDNAPSLKSINLTSLERIIQSDYAYDVGFNVTNTGLVNLNFPALKKIVGNVTIQSNISLLSISFPVLDIACANYNSKKFFDFIVGGNLRLGSISFTSLKFIGNLIMTYQPIPISFPMLDSANGLKFINGITSLSAPQLKKVLTSFEISNNINTLSSINCPSLKHCGSLTIYDNNKLSSINLVSLKVAKSIEINSNTVLTTFNAPVLDSSGIINIQYCNISSLSFPLLKVAGGIDFNNMSQLTSIDLPVLNTISGRLVIQQLLTLNNLNITSLTTAGDITFNANPLLATLALPSLISANNITVFSCNNINTLNFPVLKRINGSYGPLGYNPLVISQNNLLTSLSFPQLNYIDPQINIISNPLLSSITLTNLDTIKSSTIQMQTNKLSSAQINNILNKLVSINIRGKIIYLQQTPAAPPTGQGITDKVTLYSRGNTVYTD